MTFTYKCIKRAKYAQKYIFKTIDRIEKNLVTLIKILIENGWIRIF